MGTWNAVHVSDIHLVGYSEDSIYDRNRDIRDELVADLHAVSETTGQLDSLIIGGDIAGSGQPHQFEAASNWINGICDEFGIHPDGVFCVPGNHDVEWNAVRADPVVGLLQAGLLEVDAEVAIERIEKLLTVGPHRDLLLRGLENYNQFAAKFGCDISPERHGWDAKVDLGPFSLRIVGLSSPLLSGPGDARDPKQSRLILGSQSSLVKPTVDDICVVICHHPPDWFRDSADAEAQLSKAHIQLFGHIHTRAAAHHGNGARISAGALHPDRGSGDFHPSYNVLSMSWDDEELEAVTLIVHERGYSKHHEFEALSEPAKEFALGLGKPASSAQEPAKPEHPEALCPPEHLNRKEYARRFAMISTERRITIGKKLGLIGPTDSALNIDTLGRMVFHRADASGLLEALADHMGEQ